MNRVYNCTYIYIDYYPGESVGYVTKESDVVYFNIPVVGTVDWKLWEECAEHDTYGLRLGAQCVSETMESMASS